MTGSDGQPNYAKMSHDKIRFLYDNLRRDDADKALSEGRLMHKALYPNLYNETSNKPDSTNNPVVPGKVVPGPVAAQPTGSVERARYYVGDSVAEGLGGKNRFAKVGRSAPDTLSMLIKQPEGFFRGQDVVLSSGILNGGTMEDVRKQLQHLVSDGASVKLVGAPKFNTRFAGFNDQLSSLADEFGIEFGGGYDARGTDHIHPQYINHPYYQR